MYDLAPIWDAFLDRLATGLFLPLKEPCKQHPASSASLQVQPPHACSYTASTQQVRARSPLCLQGKGKALHVFKPRATRLLTTPDVSLAAMPARGPLTRRPSCTDACRMLAASGGPLLPPRSKLRTSCESSSSKIAAPATACKMKNARQSNWPPVEELRHSVAHGTPGAAYAAPGQVPRTQQLPATEASLSHMAVNSNRSIAK